MKRVIHIFVSLRSRNRIKKSVNKLQNTDGTFTTDLSEILDMQRDFYKDLYSSKCTQTTDQINEYLNTINAPKLPVEDKLSCEGLLTFDECQKVVKT